LLLLLLLLRLPCLLPIVELLGRSFAISCSFWAIVIRAARVRGSGVDRANAKHCAAVPLNSSVRSAIGFLALLNQTTAESSEKHREPTPIESSSLCKIAQ
jgi:hypothetical protein